MARINRLLRREEPKGDRLASDVARLAHPLRGPDDLDPLLDRIGDAPVVLLGESSHGTAEYYDWRAALSRRLIEEKDFSFIAVEGDWPDSYRVNRYVKGMPDAGPNAFEVLHAFERWPTWMWANEEVVRLAEWLHDHNAARPPDRRTGFYGLDVYSLWDSLYSLLGYLRQREPAALPAALQAWRCFEPYGEDVQEYARATALVPTSCEKEVVALLQEVRQRAAGSGTRAGREALGADPRPRRPVPGDPEAAFEAEQNALVLKNAEAYYRAMVRGGPDSWNVRDRHMAETLGRLLRHYGADARAIVWEHNTHIGDARYTDMATDGMVNIGQLARERWGGDQVVLVGFGGHRGSVIAGREWDAPLERMRVPPGREGSWEDVLHRAGPEDKLLVFSDPGWEAEALHAWRGQRAIGVVYHPEYEHLGNYVPTVLPRRYDAFLYFDETNALHPLHVPARAEHEVPETYPSGV